MRLERRLVELAFNLDSSSDEGNNVKVANGTLAVDVEVRC